VKAFGELVLIIAAVAVVYWLMTHVHIRVP
jgi:hypothetical protein